MSESIFMSEGKSELFDINWDEKEVMTKCGDFYYDYSISFADIERLYKSIKKHGNIEPTHKSVEFHTRPIRTTYVVKNMTDRQINEMHELEKMIVDRQEVQLLKNLNKMVEYYNKHGMIPNIEDIEEVKNERN